MACLARQNSLFESGPGEGTETQNIHHGLTSLLTVPMCTRLTYATGPALLSARPYICGSLSLYISLWEVTRTNLWVRPFYWWDYEKETSFKPLDIGHLLILNRIIWLIKGLKVLKVKLTHSFFHLKVHSTRCVFQHVRPETVISHANNVVYM